MELLLQLAVNGIANGSTDALLAVAWALIFSTTRVVHFAFGPFYTLAAYLVWSAAMPLKLPLALAGVLSYLLLYRSFEKQSRAGLSFACRGTENRTFGCGIGRQL